MKVTETKSVLSEKIVSMESRIRNQELEAIQLGQDKRYYLIFLHNECCIVPNKTIIAFSLTMWPN